MCNACRRLQKETLLHRYKSLQAHLKDGTILIYSDHVLPFPTLIGKLVLKLMCSMHSLSESLAALHPTTSTVVPRQIDLLNLAKGPELPADINPQSCYIAIHVADTHPIAEHAHQCLTCIIYRITIGKLATTLARQYKFLINLLLHNI